MFVNAIIKVRMEKRKIKPFTQKELLESAKQSERDYLSGKIKDQKQMEKESENW